MTQVARLDLERRRRGWEELEKKREGKGGREGWKEWSLRVKNGGEWEKL